MNHVYRVVWNENTGCFAAVAETAAGRAKGGGRLRRSRRLAAALLLATGVQAQAGPTGEQVTAGQGSVTRDGAVTTITQGSSRLAINWQSFGIANGETVNFVQPGAGAIALNRVTGTEASQIHGALNANGQVFLLNPNGVLFGRTAQVSVGGLLASTLSLSDADFLAGRTVLRGSGGVVSNEGVLKAAEGGYIALVGAQVHNTGTVQADRGTAALAAGSKVTLDFSGDGLLKLVVDEGVLQALVRNGGVVQADGGTALLTAKAADALAATVVNNTGIVRARTLDNRGGVVRLLGGFEGGTVEAGGTLDASAPAGGDAGQVETSGAHVRILPGARVDVAAPSGRAGHWLMDPTDITIDAGAAAAIATVLDAGGGVTTSTAGGGTDAGDILLASPVTWTGTGTWSLEADRDIHIQAAISGMNGGLALTAANTIDATAAVNVGTFTLNAGDWRQLGPSLPAFSAGDFTISGGSFLRAAGGDGSIADPYRIADVYGLQGITSDTTGTNNTLAQNYLLANDIDAAGTANWNGTSGFRPIGSLWDLFTGSFDGGGHVVSNLVVGGFENVGLFGAVDATGSVRNLGVRGGTVNGAAAVGGVAGYNLGTIVNVWSSATVTGDYAGGVVGWNGGSVSDSHADGAVSGSQNVGGFVGRNEGAITRAWATGAVDSAAGTGGFAGSNAATGTITVAYATGAVHSTNGSTGGFVGYNEGSIANAYATGAVTSLHAPPDPVVTQHTGGFVGRLESGSLTNVYATGLVTNDSAYKGGIGGSKGITATLSGAYWDRTSTGMTRGFGGITGGTGLTATQAKLQSSYAGFDFANTWVVYGGQTHPLLRAFLKPLTVTAGDAGRTYDGTAYAGGNGVSYSGTPDASLLLGTLAYGGSSQGAKDAGTYGITASGLYSSQQGYLITYAPGTLTIAKKTLDLTGISASDKVYDAGTAAALLTGGAALSGVVAGDTVILSTAGMTGSFASKDVGSGKAVTVTGAVISGASANNYTVGSPAGITASITPATLTLVGVSAADKVYDATTAAILNMAGAGVSGVLGSDSVSFDGSALAGRFADKNVGNAKSVTVTGAALAGADAANYVLANPVLSAGITPAALAVVAEDKAKAAGAADPALTYLASGFVGGETAATALGGSLARNPGEAAGRYAITQGSLSAANGNYAIAYTPGTLAIAAPPAPEATGSGSTPGTDPAAARVLLPAYPRPEVPAAPACAGRAPGVTDAAACTRIVPLRIVEEGVRLPARLSLP